MSKNVMIPDCTRPFFEVEINGKKYRYRSGTEQEVPDDVAQVIEQHTEAHEKKPVFNGGSQPDLNQNDPTAPDYVKNRTHYDSRETVSIDYDGVLEGKEYVNGSPDPENPMYLVKVSGVAPTLEEVIGGTYSVFESGEILDIEITEDLIEQNDEASYGIDGGIVVCLEDTNLEGMSLTKGVWFLHFMVDGFFCNLSYIKKGGELKKIDPKYLPDGIGGGGRVYVHYNPDEHSLTVNGETPSVEQWIEWAKKVTDFYVTGHVDGFDVYAIPCMLRIRSGCGSTALYLDIRGGNMTSTTMARAAILTTEQIAEIVDAWNAL